MSHELRTPLERHHRLHRDAEGGCRTTGGTAAEPLAASCAPAACCSADQRGPRPGEDRGRQARAAPGGVDARRAARATSVDTAAAAGGEEPQPPDPGAAGAGWADRGRPDAAAPDRAQPALERVQVHRGRDGHARGAPRAGRRRALSVHDTGIGIAPEQMDRLFQDFSQAGEPGSAAMAARAWGSRSAGGSPG